MPDPDAHVSPPDVAHRGAAAVVRGVHSLEVRLGEADLDRKNPVRPRLVRRPVVRPEGRLLRAPGGERVAVVAPSGDLESLVSGVGVGHTENHGVGEAGVGGGRHLLLQPRGLPDQRQAPSLAKRIRHLRDPLLGEREVRDLLARDEQGLRRGEDPQGLLGLAVLRDQRQAAVHGLVELEDEALRLNAGLHLTAAPRAHEQAQREREREQRDESVPHDASPIDSSGRRGPRRAAPPRR